MNATIVQQKVRQAVGILQELGLECWLTFVRETTETGDPVLPLILGQELTWPSALIVTIDGEAIAIVGKYEDEAVRATGAWTEVIPYVEGVRDPLVRTLDRLAPRRIAVNWSRHDPKADGLSHGMHELLLDHLEATPHARRLVSAEKVVGALRGRKTAAELQRIDDAIEATNAVFREIAGAATVGMPETEVSARMHAACDALGGETAWARPMCPIVTTGPGSMVGHGLPSPELAIRRGCVFHLDFGVRLRDYCADVQRCWWVPREGELHPPEEVVRAFDAVRAAILAASLELRPGVELRHADAAARVALVGAGFPEYQHATGHQVGRAAHDGGGVIGPTWERYGRAPYQLAEVGQVWTLELGVDLPDHGYLGLEEMVRVTDHGCTWMTEPQTALWALGEHPARIC